MKKLLLTITALLTILTTTVAQTTPFVIPSLHNWKATKGEATFNVFDIDNITFDSEEFRSAANLVQHRLLRMRDSVNVYDGKTKLDPARTIRFERQNAKKFGLEGYSLTISAKGITIQASQARGAIWGAQTLLQLIDNKWQEIPYGTTTDAPEYKLRGFMIDCGRNTSPWTTCAVWFAACPTTR